MDNQVTECSICYDNIDRGGKIIFLECLHSICSICIQKLRYPLCPFCRVKICKEIILSSKKITNPVVCSRNISPRKIRIKHKKFTDCLESMGGPMDEWLLIGPRSL